MVLFGACRSPVEPLAVTLTGASAIERTDAGERYWFDAPDAPTVTAGARQLHVRWDAAEARVVEGPSVRLERPSDGEHTLTLSTGRAARTLRLVFRAPARAITDAFAAKARADAGGARRELDTRPPHEWPWACVGLAREAATRDKADAYSACAQGAEERGFITEAISRRIAALHWARSLRQLGRARALIDQLDRALRDFPEVRLASQFHYQQSVFLAETGELRDAERVLRLAIDESARAQRPDEAALYRAYAAVIVSESGHHADALAEARALEGVASPALSPKDQLALRSNLAWVKLRAFAQHVSGVDAGALRDELTKLAADGLAADQPLHASDTLSNLAWLELTQGHFDRATEAVAKARAHAGDAQTVEVLFLDWLEGRLALASGDGAGAVRAFEAMLQRGSRSVDRFADSAWRAHLGLAEARLQLNQRAEAVKALGEARAALSQQARDFDPSQRVAFLQDRRSAIANAVEAFVRAGKCDIAWRLADDGQAWLARSFESDRRVRLAQLTPTARAAFERDEEAWALEREALLSAAPPALASVEELEAWKTARALALEQLRTRANGLAAALDAQAPLRTRAAFEPSALAADEALLEWFHTPAGDRLFVVRAKGVSCPAPGAPLALPGVAHVTLVDGGARLDAAFIHSLLKTATVSFVPSAAWLTQPPAQPSGVPLVIGDPRFDLPAARAEARAAAKALGGELLEGDAATLEAVLAAWARRPVVHFAGHGRLNASAPWEARLELAKGQALDFELLLSRHPAPGLVVLSGCETGTALDAPADGIGLAEGFLAGGANQVLATTIEVRDERARTFIERFYRLGGAENPTTAFRLAALEARAAGDSSWEEWKLFGRRALSARR